MEILKSKETFHEHERMVSVATSLATVNEMSSKRLGKKIVKIAR